MKPWQSWRLNDWNEQLLDHFFLKQQDTADLPVVNLLVTSEELACATRAPDADAKVVRDTFIQAVLDELPDGKDVIGHAMDLPCNVDFADVKPGFFAHLILSCIAAAESSSDLACEGSYRERLHLLARGRSSERTLHFLRDLWEKFQRWLNSSQNQTRYRRLILPTLGSHTRIGYSEGLAFPDRKDQRALSLMLRDNGFVGEIPPPGPILSIVAKNLTLFKGSFVSAYHDFRDRYLEIGLAGTAELRGHRFWSAIVEAALRGRGPEERRNPVSLIDLVVSYDGEELELFLLAGKPVQRPQSGWETLELPSQLGDWRYAIVDFATQSCRKLVEALLSQTLQLRGLSSLVKQGIVPLRPVLFDYLGPASGAEELRTARFALVRGDLLPAVKATFGGRECPGQRPAPGWFFVEGLTLHTWQSGDVAPSELESVWLLQPHLSAPRLTLSNGIRSDDGWLGYAEVLPTVGIAGASHVTVSSSGTSFALSPAGEGEWRFPFRDVAGPAEISAFHDTTLLARSEVHFHAAPATESYKEPRDPYAYYVEGFSGTQPLVEAACLTADEQADVGVRTGRVIFLGPGHGEFVADESAAAWKVVRTGPRSTVISLPNSEKAGAPPPEKANTSNPRRRWRTLLEQSVPSDEPVLRERLVATKKLLHGGVQLKLAEYSDTTVVGLRVRDVPQVADEVTRFIAAVAGRACARAGLPFAEWRGLVAKCFGLPERAENPDRCAIEALTRCWMEAGYIEVATSARWRSRLVFPLRPTLALHRCGSVYSAVLIGLGLPATIRALTSSAREKGLYVDERRSPCRFVPSTIVLSSVSMDHIAQAAGPTVPVKWAKVPDVATRKAVEDGNSAPRNYEKQRTIQPSLAGKVIGSVKVSQWAHERLPSYWLADDGATPAWTYSKNSARLLACRMASIAPLAVRGDNELIAEHAYLPLPLARYVAMLGPTLPGPESLAEGGAGHIYTFGTRTFRDEILTAV